MAHEAQRYFFQTVKEEFPEFFTNQRVLEVGSLDINGSCRDFFEGGLYIGCDVANGPGVDIIQQGQDLNFPDESFDVAISGECFEHNPYWKETFENMVRMTRKNGLIVFSCAGEGRLEHGTARTDVGSSPLTVGLGWDYYRNLMESDFDSEVDLSTLGSYHFFYSIVASDLYFVGVKGVRKNEIANVARKINQWLA